MRDGVLESFMKHKHEMVEEVDPVSLEPISKVFDIRSWRFKKVENIGLSEDFSRVMEEDVRENLIAGQDYMGGENQRKQNL